MATKKRKRIFASSKLLKNKTHKFVSLKTVKVSTFSNFKGQNKRILDCHRRSKLQAIIF